MDGDFEKTQVDDDTSIQITKMDDSRYSTNYHVSTKYYPYIHGYKGKMKNSIENETMTELKIPERGQDGDITILGPSAANVKAAWQKIHAEVVGMRMKGKPTHFIWIPLNEPHITDKFIWFKEAVLQNCQNRGLEESIFIRSSQLHLTVGVMSLKDEGELIIVSNLLKEAKTKVIMPLLQVHLPLKIKIKGLNFMDNDPKNMRVLYAEVEEYESTPGILQQLADEIVDYFSKKGWMNKKAFGRDSVKLHVTLLNSWYRTDSQDVRTNFQDVRTNSQDVRTNSQDVRTNSQDVRTNSQDVRTNSQDVRTNSQDVRTNSQDVRENYWKNKKILFDGSDILDKYGDFEFGVVELTEIHLSHMDCVGPDGNYTSIFDIKLP